MGSQNVSQTLQVVSRLTILANGIGSTNNRNGVSSVLSLALWQNLSPRCKLEMGIQTEAYEGWYYILDDQTELEFRKWLAKLQTLFLEGTYVQVGSRLKFITSRASRWQQYNSNGVSTFQSPARQWLRVGVSTSSWTTSSYLEWSYARGLSSERIYCRNMIMKQIEEGSVPFKLPASFSDWSQVKNSFVITKNEKTSKPSWKLWEVSLIVRRGTVR